MDWDGWQLRFKCFVQEQMAEDPGHDLAHIQRVVANALTLARETEAPLEIVLPAAWLHDCVIVPKNSPQRPFASQIAAETAVAFLCEQAYPERFLAEIEHAIAAHSFSANIPPQSLAAKVVQDADRLDAIGAIGIARCFAIGGKLARPLYLPPDPFCEERKPDDRLATVDHFYTKLLTLVDTMQTKAGRQEARKRTDFMLDFLAQLKREIESEIRV